MRKETGITSILVAAMLGTLIGCGSEPAGNGSAGASGPAESTAAAQEKPPSRLKHLKTRTSGR